MPDIPLEKILSVPLERIIGSVVCIRGSSLYEGAIPSALEMENYTLTGKTLPGVHDIPTHHALLRNRYHGTGVVIDRDDLGHAILLTNRHVTIPSMGNVTYDDKENEIGAIKLDRHTLTIVDDMYDLLEGRPELEILAVAPDHDAALLRTKTPSALPVCPAIIGAGRYALSQGTDVLTVGYPLGDRKIVAGGTIMSLDGLDINLTPYPNRHLLVDIPLDIGQSGSPVFSMNPETGQYHLIGLVYGGAENLDTVKMVTPLDEFMRLILTWKDMPSRQPRLDAPLDQSRIDAVLARHRTMTALPGKGLELSRREQGYTLREYEMSGAHPVLSTYLDWDVDPAGRPTSVTVVDGDCTAVHTIPPGVFPIAARNVLGKINHLLNISEHNVRNGTRMGSDDMRMHLYMIRMMNQHVNILAMDDAVLTTALYRAGIVTETFI